MRQIESFFWGIIAALGALFVQLIVFFGYSFISQSQAISFDSFYANANFILLGVAIEEIFKYIMIWKRIENYSLAKTYLLNSWLVGLGFFAIELGLIQASGNAVDFQTLVGLTTVHLGTAGIMGYLVAIKNPHKFATCLQAVIIASALHGAFNYLANYQHWTQLYLVDTLLIFLLALNLFNLLRINHKLAS